MVFAPDITTQRTNEIMPGQEGVIDSKLHRPKQSDLVLDEFLAEAYRGGGENGFSPSFVSNQVIR